MVNENVIRKRRKSIFRQTSDNVFNACVDLRSSNVDRDRCVFREAKKQDGNVEIEFGVSGPAR